MKKANQSGQSLVESLIAILILLLCTFSVVEISRLLAFKSYLQVLTADMAQQISFSHLSLIRERVITQSQKSSGIQINAFEKKIKGEIEKKLSLFQTSLFSFDQNKSAKKQDLLYLDEHHISLQLEFINAQTFHSNSKNTPGVYLKINSCLPVLFSGYFRNFKKGDKKIPQIGKTIQERNLNDMESSRNCLGHYTSSSIFTPIFWFRVRSAVYFPWPASSSIYEKGFAIPTHFSGIENKYREDLLHSLENIDLSLFFNK